MDNLQSQEFLNRNKIEGDKEEHIEEKDVIFDDVRPESTEIRIDPGGHTATNFHKSNDSPFFFPEIKPNLNKYDNIPINNELPIFRQGYTATHANQTLNNLQQNKKPHGKKYSK